MAKVSNQGITGKSLNEYEDEVKQGYQDINSDWNVEPESPDGQAIAIWAELLANLDEIVQYAYMSRDPATAQGQALNDIADYAGLQRQDATYSTCPVTLSGVNGTLIPQGSRIRNSATDTQWELDTETEIQGNTSAFVTAVEAGRKTAAIGALTEIVDPVAGWQSVTNPEAAAQGEDEEPEEEFRIRRNQSVARLGSNQIDNIFSAVSNVDSVNQVKTYENSESAANANGLNPNSIAIFVRGGENSDIFDAIAAKKNPGVNMNADNGIANEQTETAQTPLGQDVGITFFRPETVSIFVTVTISTDQLSQSQKPSIKQAIVDFSLEGLTGQGDGFTRRGFQIGERVAAGRLYTPVNEIVAGEGFVESIEVSDSESGDGATSVPIAFNQLAVFDVSNITVTYVD